MTTRTVPRRVEELTAVMGQWTGGPPKDKRRVMLDEGARRAGRRVRLEDEKSRISEERSAEATSRVERQTEEDKAREVPKPEDVRQKSREE